MGNKISKNNCITPNEGEEEWLLRSCSAYYDRNLLQRVSCSAYSFFDDDLATISTVASSACSSNPIAAVSKTKSEHTLLNEFDVYDHSRYNGNNKDYLELLNDVTLKECISVFCNKGLMSRHFNDESVNLPSDIENDTNMSNDNIIFVDDNGICNMDDKCVQFILKNSNFQSELELPRATQTCDLLRLSQMSTCMNLEKKLRRRAVMCLHSAISRQVASIESQKAATNVCYPDNHLASTIFNLPISDSYEKQTPGELFTATSLAATISVIASFRDVVINNYNCDQYDGKDVMLYNIHFNRFVIAFLKNLCRSTVCGSKASNATLSDDDPVKYSIESVQKWDADLSSSSLVICEKKIIVNSCDENASINHVVYARLLHLQCTLSILLGTASITREDGAFSVGVCSGTGGYLGGFETSSNFVGLRSGPMGTFIGSPTIADFLPNAVFRPLTVGDIISLHVNVAEGWCDIIINIIEYKSRLLLNSSLDYNDYLFCASIGYHALTIITHPLRHLYGYLSGECTTNCANGHGMSKRSGIPPLYAAHGTQLDINCNRCNRALIHKDNLCYHHCDSCNYYICFICHMDLFPQHMETTGVSNVSSTEISKPPVADSKCTAINVTSINPVVNLKGKAMLTSSVEDLICLFRGDILHRNILNVSKDAPRHGNLPLHPVVSSKPCSNPFATKYQSDTNAVATSLESLTESRSSLSLTAMLVLGILKHSIESLIEVIYYLLDPSIHLYGEPTTILPSGSFAIKYLLAMLSGATRQATPKYVDAFFREDVQNTCADNKHVTGTTNINNELFYDLDWKVDTAYSKAERQAFFILEMLSDLSVSSSIFTIENDYIFDLLLEMIEEAAIVLAKCTLQVKQPNASNDTIDVETLRCYKKAIILGRYALIIIVHNISRISVSATTLNVPYRCKNDRKCEIASLTNQLMHCTDYGTSGACKKYIYCVGDTDKSATWLHFTSTYREYLRSIVNLLIVNPMIDPFRNSLGNNAILIAANDAIFMPYPSEQFRAIHVLLVSVQEGIDTDCERNLCLQLMRALQGSKILHLVNPVDDSNPSPNEPYQEQDSVIQSILFLANNALDANVATICNDHVCNAVASRREKDVAQLQDQLFRVLEPLVMQTISVIFTDIQLSINCEVSNDDRLESNIIRMVSLMEKLITSANCSIDNMYVCFKKLSTQCARDVNRCSNLISYIDNVIDRSHIGSMIPLSLFTLTLLWENLSKSDYGYLCNTFISLFDSLNTLMVSIQKVTTIRNLNFIEGDYCGGDDNRANNACNDAEKNKWLEQLPQQVTSFDSSISNASLEFSDGNSSCRRPGSVSCYPAAFSLINKHRAVFTVVIEEAASRTNWLSIGLCHAGFPGTSSDGFGRTAHSWGIADDRSKDHEPAFFTSFTLKTYPAPRKLKKGDVISISIDLLQGYAAFSVNGGEITHTFGPASGNDAANVGPTGDPTGFWFGATFANDHKLRITSSEILESIPTSNVPPLETLWSVRLTKEVMTPLAYISKQLLEQSFFKRKNSFSRNDVKGCCEWLNKPLFSNGIVQINDAFQHKVTSVLTPYSSIYTPFRSGSCDVNQAYVSDYVEHIGLTEREQMQWRLLHQLTDAPLGLGLSQFLVTVMKQYVKRDRGSEAGPNHIVHAAIASMIWHEGCGEEALDISINGEKGIDVKPSKGLERIWLMGQDLRATYQECCDDISSPVDDDLNSPIDLLRQHSLPPLQRGQMPLNHSILSAVRRARLLLTFPPKVSLNSSFSSYDFQHLGMDRGSTSQTGELNIATLVLDFIVNGPDPDLVRTVSHERSLDTDARVKGLKLAKSLIDVTDDTRFQVKILQTVASSLFNGSRINADEYEFHYLHGLRGGKFHKIGYLRMAWAEMVKTVINCCNMTVLRLAQLSSNCKLHDPFCLGNSVPDKYISHNHSLLIESIVTSIAVLSLDYEYMCFEDLEALSKHGVVSLIRKIMQCFSKQVRAAARRLLNIVIRSIVALLPHLNAPNASTMESFLSDLIILLSSCLQSPLIAVIDFNVGRAMSSIATTVQRNWIYEGQIICNHADDGLVIPYPSLDIDDAKSHAYDLSVSLWLWYASRDTATKHFFTIARSSFKFLSLTLCEGKLQVYVGDGESPTLLLSSPSSLVLRKWSHVGISIHSSVQKVFMYIDGYTVATAAIPKHHIPIFTRHELKRSNCYVGQFPSSHKEKAYYRLTTECAVASISILANAISHSDHCDVAMTDFLHLNTTEDRDCAFKSSRYGLTFENTSTLSKSAYANIPMNSGKVSMKILIDKFDSTCPMSVGLLYASFAGTSHTCIVSGPQGCTIVTSDSLLALQAQCFRCGDKAVDACFPLSSEDIVTIDLDLAGATLPALHFSILFHTSQTLYTYDCSLSLNATSDAVDGNVLPETGTHNWKSFLFAATVPGGAQLVLLNDTHPINSIATTVCESINDGFLDYSNVDKIDNICYWDVGLFVPPPGVISVTGGDVFVANITDTLDTLSMVSPIIHCLTCGIGQHKDNKTANKGIVMVQHILSVILLNGNSLLQAIIGLTFCSSSSITRLAATNVLCDVLPFVGVSEVCECFYRLRLLQHVITQSDSLGNKYHLGLIDRKSIAVSASKGHCNDSLGVFSGKAIINLCVQILGSLVNPYGSDILHGNESYVTSVASDTVNGTNIVLTLSLHCYGRIAMAYQLQRLLSTLIISPFRHWQHNVNTCMSRLLESSHTSLDMIKCFHFKHIAAKSVSKSVGDLKADVILGVMAVCTHWQKSLGILPGSTLMHKGVGSTLWEHFVVTGCDSDSCGDRFYLTPLPSGDIVDGWSADKALANTESVFLSYILSEQSQYATQYSTNYLKHISGTQYFPAVCNLLLNAINLDTAYFGSSAEIAQMKQAAIREVKQTYESNHPYADNSDEYVMVHVPHADELIITFDSRTRTESNYDFVKFYKDSSKSTHYGKDKYSGSSNWPGVDIEPLRIPGNSFVLFFHSDESANDWGYSFTVSILSKAKAIENVACPDSLLLLRLIKLIALESMNNISISGYISEKQLKANPSLWKTLLSSITVFTAMQSLHKAADDCVLVDLSTKPENNIDRAMLQLQGLLSMKRIGKVKSELSCTASNTVNSDDEMTSLVASSFSSLSAKLFDGVTEHNQKLFNKYDSDASDTVTSKCEVSGGSLDSLTSTGMSATLLDALQATSQPAMYTINDSHCLESTILNVNKEGDIEATTSCCERRSEGVLYRLRCSNGTTHCRIRALPSLSSAEAGDLKHGSVVEVSSLISGFYRLADKKGFVKMNVLDAVEWDCISTDVNNTLSHSQVLDEATLEGIVITELDTAITAGCFSLLCTILSTWSIERCAPFEADCDGQLMTLLNVSGLGKEIYRVKGGVDDVHQRSALLTACLKMIANCSSDKQRIPKLVISLSQISSLIFKRIDFLARSSSNDGVLSSVIPPPPPPPLMLESLHEYENNSDICRLIEIPGAGGLEFVFDDECSTEKNYDYVAIYEDEGRKNSLSPKFSGRRHSTDKNWPGVDGKPSFILENCSKCWLSFVSDGSNTDWGWKLTVRPYGNKSRTELVGSMSVNADLRIITNSNYQAVDVSDVEVSILDCRFVLSGASLCPHLGLALSLSQIIVDSPCIENLLLHTMNGEVLMACFASCSSIIINAHQNLLLLFVDIVFKVLVIGNDNIDALMTNQVSTTMVNQFQILAKFTLSLASSIQPAYKPNAKVTPRNSIPPQLMHSIGEAALAADAFVTSLNCRKDTVKVNVIPQDIGVSGLDDGTNSNTFDEASLCLGNKIVVCNNGRGLMMKEAVAVECSEDVRSTGNSAIAWGPLYTRLYNGKVSPESRGTCMYLYSKTHYVQARSISLTITLGIALIPLKGHQQVPFSGFIGLIPQSVGVQFVSAHESASRSDSIYLPVVYAVDETDHYLLASGISLDDGDIVGLTFTVIDSLHWSLDVYRNGIQMIKILNKVPCPLFSGRLLLYDDCASEYSDTAGLYAVALACNLTSGCEVFFIDDETLAIDTGVCVDSVIPSSMLDRWKDDDPHHNTTHSAIKKVKVHSQWDLDQSNSTLVFSDDNTSAKRPGSVSCYPAALVKVTDASSCLSLKLIDCPLGPNSMSIGIAHSSTMHKSGTDGFGPTKLSWGIIESRTCGDGKVVSNQTAVGTVRKMDKGDIFSIRYERLLGKAWISLGRKENINDYDALHEFDVHEPGEAVGIVMGATFCNDHKLQILNIPPIALPKSYINQYMSTVESSSPVALSPRNSSPHVPRVTSNGNSDVVSTYSHANDSSMETITRWDVSISQPALCYSNNDRTASRPAKCTPYPTAFAPITKSRSCFTAELEKCPTANNTMSIGVTIEGFPVSGHQGVGERAQSWGIYCNRSASNDEGTKVIACGKLVGSYRKMKSGDRVNIVVDREKQVAHFTITGDRLVYKHTFENLPQASKQLLFGAAFCNNHVLTIIAEEDTDGKTFVNIVEDGAGCGLVGGSQENMCNKTLGFFTSLTPSYVYHRNRKSSVMGKPRYTAVIEELKVSTVSDQMLALRNCSCKSHLTSFLSPLRQVRELLRYFLSTKVDGEELIASNFLIEDCLPYVCSFASKTVDLVATPNDSRKSIEVFVPDAVAYVVEVLDPSSMSSDYRLTITTKGESGESVLLDCVGMSSIEKSEDFVPVSEYADFVDSLNQKPLVASKRMGGGLIIGDVVTRGPRWTLSSSSICGNSDGQPGALGDVVAVSKTEVVVRWRVGGSIVSYPFTSDDSTSTSGSNVDQNDSYCSGMLSLWMIGANVMHADGRLRRRRMKTAVLTSSIAVALRRISPISDTPASLKLRVTPVIPPSKLLTTPAFNIVRHQLSCWYNGGNVAQDVSSIAAVCDSSITALGYKKRSNAINYALIHAIEASLASRGLSAESILSKSWDQLNLSPQSFTQQQILSEVMAKNKEDDGRRVLSSRFALIQSFNVELLKCIDLVNMSSSTSERSVPSYRYYAETMSYLINKGKGYIFLCVKNCVLSAAMSRSETQNGLKFELIISRSRAAHYVALNEVDVDGRWTVFGQAFRKIHGVPSSALRRTGQLWDTVFAGERAHDAGGPYREVWSAISHDLMSPYLPLLKPSPNNVNNIGKCRDTFVLNPDFINSNISGNAFGDTYTRISMFIFLGKLLGSAARSKNYMDLCLSPIVWKMVLCDDVGIDDIMDIDYTLVNWIQQLGNRKDLNDEMFNLEYPDITFTAISLGGSLVELHPGGSTEAVLWGESLNRYCKEMIDFKLHEMKATAATVRFGLDSQLPPAFLHLISWHELEEMVCGKAEIDITLLKSITEYERGCTASDQHILWFWELMENDFSYSDKKAFLRFTWGRARLPTSKANFSQVLKIQELQKSPPDLYLPVAHTCFFNIEIPRYSRKEIMKEKLLYAIYNCLVIDGDDTSAGHRAANLGFEF